MAMAEKRLNGRIVSIPPNKYMLERPMMNGKKRLIGRIFSVRPNKFMLERLMFKGKKRPKFNFYLKKGSVQPNILKGGKWRLKVEDGEEDNLISKLPDEILVSIMFRLTTEEAGRMSVVSRRWLKIWNTSIRITPKLTFDMENRLGKGWFIEGRGSHLTDEMIDVVNGIVKLHEAPTLEEFTIGFYMSSLNSHHLNKWMDFAAKKHVKKLTLQFYPWISYSSPLYDATFLAENYPMYWLKDLCVGGMHATENAIQRLLSNSPFLERFSLHFPGGKLHRLKMVCGSNLKYLGIFRGPRLQHLEISAQNLNTVELEQGSLVPLQCHSIFAPNLSHLILAVCRCFKFDDFSLSLLGQINRLTLRIECDLFMDKMSAPFLFPQFSKLHHLELIMVLGCEISFHHLPPLLEAAPFLKTLSLAPDRAYACGDNGLKWLDKHIPKANQKQLCQDLKVVKFDNFAGYQYDIEFFLCLLEYAMSVEKIIIQLLPLSAWIHSKVIINADQDQYEELCVGCAQLLRTKILQMHPCANVTIL